MIAFTSISPGHKNNESQLRAVHSWAEAGLKVVSMNHPDEIDKLKELYPDFVRFIPTYRTLEKLFEKPYVSINAMLDYAKTMPEHDFVLINSDIILHEAKDVLRKYFEGKCKQGPGVIKRVDFDNDFSDGTTYEYGMDVFLLKREHLNIFPQGIYCMGQTWWDYWVPYSAIQSGLKPFLIPERIAYHKKHPIQYRNDQWFKMTAYFQWENNYFTKQNKADRITGSIYHFLHGHFAANA
jgi:hypothetical protein